MFQRITLQARRSASGIAALELALILPILAVMVFWIIDFGRLVYARMIITNVSREGGSLVSRGISSGDTILTLLQASGRPLDLNASGRIYATRIAAGTSLGNPNPTIDNTRRWSRGSLGVSSSIGSGISLLGLPQSLYDHLRFRGAPQNTSDISEVWVVEVYFLYRPMTPLPDMIENLIVTPGYDGRVLGSRALF